MRGNTPFWDGVKRPSGRYVTFSNKKKHLNFEEILVSK